MSLESDNPQAAQAAVLIDELVAGGVTDVVLAPGSRSAPLAFALHAADAAGRLRLHVRIDERGAGFLALGLGKASGRPAVVVTTSGTAVANLHPAVLEAHHGGVPLVVLSADRPHRLRGVGANQVIDQLAVFGGGVLRYQHELAAAADAGDAQEGYWRGQVCRALAGARGHLDGGLPGPAQLNVPFDTPLVPDAARGAAARTGRGGPWTVIPRPGGADPVIWPADGEKCLFVADLTHPWAQQVAADGGLVISEAGGLGGAGVLAAGIHLLGDRGFVDRHRPDRVIVLGRPTLFRQVASLLADAAIAVDVVDHVGRYADTAGTVRRVSPHLAWPRADRPPSSPSSRRSAGQWADAWRGADLSAARAIDGQLAGRGIDTSAALARAVAAALPQDSTLLVGSSQPPRDLALFSRPRSGVRLLANRGVAGIDGTVSTAIGVALAQQPTYALMGDLTFLHDVTALAIGPAEPRPDLTIVVAHNDGGGIFATLEQGAARYAGAFERIFGTPTGVRLAEIAGAFGLRYDRVTAHDDLAAALAAAPEGLRVIEVPVDRTGLRDFTADVAAAVHRALAVDGATGR